VLVKILDKTKPFVLSPLANITIPPYRRLCSELGADITISEMTFARSLIYRNTKSIKRTLRSISEKCYGIQLLTNNTSDFAGAVEKIEDEKLADFVELNLGCPKPKIVKANLGSALLKRENLTLLRDLIKIVSENFKIPLSLKIRLGYNEETYVDVLRIAEEFNVSFVTLHARLATDSYEVKAKKDCWKKAIEAAPNVPIIANGDIRNRDEGMKFMHELGLSGIAIGRAARGNPSVFGKKQINSLSISDLYEKLIQYMKVSGYFMPLFVKTQSSDFVKRFRYATKLRRKIVTMNDLDKIVELTKEFLIHSEQCPF